MNKNFIIALIIIIIVLAVIYWCSNFLSVTIPQEEKEDKGAVKSVLSLEQARTIAEQTCIKGGETLASIGTYNENTKTWWFDANLNATPEGCNPACVVWEVTKTAEISWRCTGLIPPNNQNLVETIQQLFAQKYDKNAADIIIQIEQEDESHAPGGVQFAPGTPGGIFLVAKIDGVWQIVHDGNGQIPCDLAKYGFPSQMLFDCAP